MLVKWNKVTNCNWKGKRDKNYSHLWKVTLCYFRTNWNFSTLFYICEWPTNFHENQYHHIRHSCIKIIKYSSIPVESYPRTNGNNFLLDVRKTAAAELKHSIYDHLKRANFDYSSSIGNKLINSVNIGRLTSEKLKCQNERALTCEWTTKSEFHVKTDCALDCLSKL